MINIKSFFDNKIDTSNMPSLRDYMAVEVMRSLMSETEYRQNHNSSELAAISYYYADAMIKARGI
jgi:hypothetical protein